MGPAALGRTALRAALLAGGLWCAVGPASSQDSGPRTFPVVSVNGNAVIENSRAARALREVERDLRARAEAANLRVQAELEAEERELLRLRDTLAPEAFEARTAAFDRRVRAERRLAQERGALLLSFVQDARGALVSALPRVLEQVRRDAGAALVLDAGVVLALDPGLDLTAYAISRYDADMGDVRFDPPADLLAPERMTPDPDAPAPDAPASDPAAPDPAAPGADAAPSTGAPAGDDP